MNELNSIGKILILTGSIILLLGLILFLSGKIPFLGKLPGDFLWKGKNWNIYFPLGTSILLSILVSLIFFIIRKINQ